MLQHRNQARTVGRGAGLGALLVSLSVLALSALGCRKPEAPTQLPSVPSLRLYLVSNVAGALEPCGCRKDMLGGMDHAAVDAKPAAAERRSRG